MVSRLLLLVLFLAACQGDRADPASPTPGVTVERTAIAQPPAPGPTAGDSATIAAPSSPTPISTATAPAVTPTPFFIMQTQAGANDQPTLVDFWLNGATFVVEVEDTGLPMGESETVLMSNGELWSYLHASERSAGVIDQCGDPVPFPGCTILMTSYDGGFSFASDGPPVCQFACQQCPCEAEIDHVSQQQYPRLFYDGRQTMLVYEYLGRVMLRRSDDGLHWGAPEQVAMSTIWKLWLRDCPPAERIGQHPFVPYDYECLAGGPPGIYVEDGLLYIFMAVGQNPGGMGCYVGGIDDHGDDFQRCRNHPLFRGAAEYGPLDERGSATNSYFDFRTISSAEVMRIGEGEAARYYMLYEGIRGPGPGDPGDSQFGLGLARSLTNQIDGAWEKYPGNPILVDLPGNIGLGHADLVVVDGQTILYTSLDGQRRSRLTLRWNEE